MASSGSLTPLVDELLRQARAAMLDGVAIGFPVSDVLRIIADLPARSDLVRRLRQNDNEELLATAIDFLLQLATQLDRAARRAERHVELIDRAGMTVAASATAGSIGLFIGLGASFGPIGMFCGGIIGLAICGTGRHVMASRSDDRRADAAEIRALVEDLRKPLPTRRERTR